MQIASCFHEKITSQLGLRFHAKIDPRRTYICMFSKNNVAQCIFQTLRSYFKSCCCDSRTMHLNAVTIVFIKLIVPAMDSVRLPRDLIAVNTVDYCHGHRRNWSVLLTVIGSYDVTFICYLCIGKLYRLITTAFVTQCTSADHLVQLVVL